MRVCVWYVCIEATKWYHEREKRYCRMGEYHDTSDTETEEVAQNRRVKGGQGMMSR